MDSEDEQNWFSGGSSTVIDFVIFDPHTNQMHIHFRKGDEYIYYDVSRKVFEAFKDASSPGTFFNHTIKDRFSFS